MVEDIPTGRPPHVPRNRPGDPPGADVPAPADPVEAGSYLAFVLDENERLRAELKAERERAEKMRAADLARERDLETAVAAYNSVLGYALGFIEFVHHTAAEAAEYIQPAAAAAALKAVNDGAANAHRLYLKTAAEIPGG